MWYYCGSPAPGVSPPTGYHCCHLKRLHWCSAHESRYSLNCRNHLNHCYGQAVEERHNGVKALEELWHKKRKINKIEQDLCVRLRVTESCNINFQVRQYNVSKRPSPVMAIKFSDAKAFSCDLCASFRTHLCNLYEMIRRALLYLKRKTHVNFRCKSLTRQIPAVHIFIT